MSVSNHYDFVMAGAGAAGRSLAWHLLDHPAMRDKRILLADKDAKQRDDRTWCFWSDGKGPFDHLVSKQWRYAKVLDFKRQLTLDLDPFRYSLIRSIDFYDATNARFKEATNVDQVIGEIEDVSPASISVEGKTYQAGQLFDSRFDPSMLQAGKHKHLLWQHFKGIEIDTEEDTFDPEVIHLMDFRVAQEGEVRFVYVLPTTARKALVEFTVFGPDIWTEEAYDSAITDYLNTHWQLTNWKVAHHEIGAIPMTDLLPLSAPKGIRLIGTPAGWVKSSTGYAFRNIQRQCQGLANELLAGSAPLKSAGRRHFYDRILLHVLNKQDYPGDQVFMDLFAKHPPARVLRFLDEQTRVGEEAQIILKSAPGPFLKAFWASLVH